MKTTKRILIDKLINCGLFENDATIIVEKAIKVIDQDSVKMDIGHKISWDAPGDYPPVLITL